MHRSGIICALALCLLAATASAADAVLDGLMAWRDHDYVTARQYWQQASDAGDVQAKFLLSELYLQGQGGPRDLDRAMTLLRESAEGGYAVACYNLGNRYLKGDGLPEDASQAARWWRRAAVQGLVHAQYNLGSLYYQGLGVPQDRQQALWWYRQAAAQGSNRALQTLAQLGEPASADDAGATGAPDGTGGTPSPAETQSLTAGPAAPAVATRQPVPASIPSRTSSDSPPAKTDASVPAALQALALGPDWLRRQPAGYFTVQVFASDDAAAVVRFLKQVRFERQVAVYPFNKAGQIWYGVVYGRFAGRDEARRAITTLPAAVQKAHPWVRGFSEVSAIMAATKG